MNCKILSVFLLLIINKLGILLAQNTTCYGPDSLTKCGLPVFFATTDSKSKYTNCKQGLKFLDCINSSSSKLCLNDTSDTFMNKLRKTVELYSQSFDQNCKIYNLTDLKTSREAFNTNLFAKNPSLNEKTENQHKANNKYLFNIKNFQGDFKKINKDDILLLTTQAPESSLTLDDDCPNDSKCEPKSLHITCGYPAANPKSNLHAYCNELKHYIQCAKCKIINCKLEVSKPIKRHLILKFESYTEKCVTTQSTTIQVPSTILLINKTFDTTSTLFNNKNYNTTILVHSSTMTTTATATATATTTTTTTATTTTTTTATTTTTTTATTTTKRPIPILTKSMENTITKLFKTNNLNSLFNQSLLTKSVYYSDKIKSNEKIENLLINFDFIDIIENTVEVISSGTTKFWAKIENKTDIFKGIRNGAIYLNSKTSLILDLMEYSKNMCITSLKESQDTLDQSCLNGWTVSFWFKVSYLNLFDKTILKVDNFIDNKVSDLSKYLLIKISNWDLRVEFLYRRKFWRIVQKFVWRPEWTMMSTTWSEFEGLNVFINGKRMFTQQIFEYYSSNDIYGTFKSNNIEDILEDEKLVNYLEKRSFNLTQSIGIINIGLTNRISRNARKFFFEYRSRITQNASMSNVYSESILLDEMFILNKKIDSKQIYNLYLKEYAISTEFDSVEEKMFLISTDNKQQEMIGIGGAMFKKSPNTDEWYFSLNGPKQFFFVPNLFDSCIIDAQNLCSFGFSLVFWFKITYNFKIFKLDSVFDQSLFYLGSTDFKSGLDAVLYVRPNSDNTFSYIVSINYGSKQATIAKHFQVYLSDISELSTLNCLVVQFTDPKNLDLIWLRHKVVEIEWPMAQINSKHTYFDYSLTDLKDFNFKSSHLTSHSIGIVGDLSKDCYFHVHKLKLKNHPQSLDQIESEFDSQNPTDVDFDSYEKLRSIVGLELHGQPALIDSKYGKSILLINNQKLIFKNVSDRCLGNLATCKNGYTLKMVFCFSNYASRNNNSSEAEKKIFLISNSAESNDTNYNFFVFYDLTVQALSIDLKLPNRLYHSEVVFKLKYFVWYSLHVTWDYADGLRVFINNRLLDHTIGSFYYNSKVNMDPIDFIIGRSDSDPAPNEIILNRFVQYNVRKHPDEIIQKNLPISEQISVKKLGASAMSSTFFWYMVSCVFLSMCFLFLIVLSLIIIRRKASNGYWSRETDGGLVVVKKSKMCCSAGQVSMEDVIQQKSGKDLELKKCRQSDRLSAHFSLDDFQTNSLYGTIDRLIVKKPLGITSNPSPTVMYTNNYNSLTKDPKLRQSSNFILNQTDNIETKKEIHF